MALRRPHKRMKMVVGPCNLRGRAVRLSWGQAPALQSPPPHPSVAGMTRWAAGARQSLGFYREWSRVHCRELQHMTKHSRPDGKMPGWSGAGTGVICPRPPHRQRIWQNVRAVTLNARFRRGCKQFYLVRPLIDRSLPQLRSSKALVGDSRSDHGCLVASLSRQDKRQPG